MADKKHAALRKIEDAEKHLQAGIEKLGEVTEAVRSLIEYTSTTGPND